MKIDLNEVPDFKNLNLAELKAEAQTNPDAMFLMAHIGVSGYGLMPINPEEAETWARKGAAKGHVFCKAFIATSLAASDTGGGRAKARDLFERIAEAIKARAAKGNPCAQYYLGVMHGTGFGAQCDFKKAAQCFESAAYQKICIGSARFGMLLSVR